MELKIDSKIAYAGEDMKKYLIEMLERTRYNYIVDTDEQTIIVLRKPQSQTVTDMSTEKVNRLFDLVMISPPMTNSWSSIFSGVIISPDNDLFRNLNKNQKLDILLEVISRYTSEYVMELYSSKMMEKFNSDKVKLANEILEIISNHYDIKKKTDK